MSATTARAPRPSKSAIDATQAPEPSVEAVVDPIESDATGEVVAPFYRNIAAEAEQGERLAFVDIKDTVAAALNQIEAICAHWLPDGKRQGHDWIARNPTRDDTHAGSFSVSLITGGCIDHATGEACRDIVSTIKYLDGLATQGEAARRLADWMGTAPIPSNAPPKAKPAPKAMKSRPARHPALGAPSATWDYLDASGAVICVVCRFDKDGKTYRPLTRTPDGWIWKAPDEPRPLYGLDRLAARTDADVILCEGEKAADAAGNLLPDAVAIASMNGAQSPNKTDWSPLSGRRVRIFPDHDEPGAQYAKTAAALAYAAGAVSVEILDLSSLADELPAGWDAADALADGWTPERIADARWIERAPPYEGTDHKAVFVEAQRAGWVNPAKREPKNVSKKDWTYLEENPSVSSVTRVESLRDTSGIPPVSEGSFRGALLWTPKDSNETKRLVDSLAANKVADHLRHKLAQDAEAGTWMLWKGTHWHPLATPAKADKAIADAVDEGTHPIGYRVSYLSGITQILTRRNLLPAPAWADNVVPFENGLLDLASGQMRPATPDDATDWVLPWSHERASDCPQTRAWLKRCVIDHDDEVVELVRAWLAALLRGIPLQSFLTVIGSGGSGKGTLARLASALIGIHNVAVTDLARLENRPFETARLYGKRLCLINEAGKYGGSVDVLKAVTGGDHLPMERKHVQQTGSFVFRGLVMMTTNEPIIATDSTSGLERRRITVRFPYSATREEKAYWSERGGIEAALHAEIPGIINWLLGMPAADITRLIESPPKRVVAENLLGMAAGNSVAEWILDACIPVPGDKTGTQIGIKDQGRDQYSGKVTFDHASDRLYPNYLRWCMETGRNHPVSLRKFSETIIDIANERLGCSVTKGRDNVSRAAHLYGIRLRKSDEPPHQWHDPEGSTRRDRSIPEVSKYDNSLNCIIRSDSAKNYSQINSEATCTAVETVIEVPV